MFEPGDVYGFLLQSHLPALREDDQRLLAARMCGMATVDIAARLFKSDRHVRASLERLEDLICLPAGIDRRDLAVTGWWFGLHTKCEHGCTARALEMICTNTIFPTTGTA